MKLTLAFHSSSLPDGRNGGNPCGFLLTLTGGTKIYFACDTALFGDMTLIGAGGLDLAVLPIGDLFTMGPDDALEAVKLLKPKRVVPSHYNTWPPIAQDAQQWAERVRSRDAGGTDRGAAGASGDTLKIRGGERQMRAISGSCLLVMMALCWPDAAGGQTLLRWKLKPDDSLRITIQQETESQVAFSGKSATTKIDLIVELDWLVTAADEKEIKLKQTLRGVKLKLQSPEGGVIEYDSGAEARPTGQAREMGESLQPLIGMEIQLTMTPRGEIVAAEPANKGAEGLLEPGKPGEQTAVSRAQVQQLLKQSLVVLPEKAVELNDEWRTTNNLSGAAGNYQQMTTYRLAGLSGARWPAGCAARDESNTRCRRGSCAAGQIAAWEETGGGQAASEITRTNGDAPVCRGSGPRAAGRADAEAYHRAAVPRSDDRGHVVEQADDELAACCAITIKAPTQSPGW